MIFQLPPLSIPMLCGPGAIANGIMLMDDANTWTMKGNSDRNNWFDLFYHLSYIAGFYPVGFYSW